MTAPIAQSTTDDLALAIQLAIALRDDGLYTAEARHLLEVATREFDPRIIIALLACRFGHAYDEAVLRECWGLALAGEPA